jgi:glycosyltransferase involved in cell wall biosynthesis
MPDGEAEGSPVVTKEGLAVGVPIVATSSGGLPETIPPAYSHCR